MILMSLKFTVTIQAMDGWEDNMDTSDDTNSVRKRIYNNLEGKYLRGKGRNQLLSENLLEGVGAKCKLCKKIYKWARMQKYQQGETHFNLMAIIQDKTVR